ncbi:MAG: hypothetical protein ACR2OC_11495 [Solirubrobacterales bacterium]
MDPQPRGLTGRTTLGYSLVLIATTMFSLNASLSLFLLEDGLSALRLSELRSVGAFLILALAILVIRPSGNAR